MHIALGLQQMGVRKITSVTPLAFGGLQKPHKKDLHISSMVSTLEKQFHAAMIDVYKRAKTEAGYNASRFLSMVSELGGLETAKVLLRSDQVSEGYVALHQRERLDLTIEAVILEREWWPLFTCEERQTAVSRLRKYGYSGQLPGVDAAL